MLQAMSDFTHAHYGGPYVQRKEFLEQFLQYPEQSEAVLRWSGSSDFSSRLPQTTPTEQENTRLLAIMAQATEYVDRMTVAFIMGELPLARLEEATAQLRALGIDEAIGIMEAALERARRR
jgi:putative aldouronate transport system substrate-binding protein